MQGTEQDIGDLSAEDQELYNMLNLMNEMGLSIKFDPSDGKTLMSSFDKTLVPFLTEIQPKIEKPAFNKDFNYLKEFWKVFITNEILVASLKEIAMEKVIMEQKVKEYDKIYQELENQIRPKKKKRRTAAEIKKNFMCPYKICKKKYGTDVALNLHIKRNHKGGNKSDREKYARELFLSLKAGNEAPPTDLKLPEDFIRTVQEEYLRLKKDGFEEEFEPTNIFRYNISNFDQIMESMSDDDNDRDSFSIRSGTMRNARNHSLDSGGSEDEDEEEEEEGDEEEDDASVISRTKSEGIGRRRVNTLALAEAHDAVAKKKKK